MQHNTTQHGTTQHKDKTTQGQENTTQTRQYKATQDKNKKGTTCSKWNE